MIKILHKANISVRSTFCAALVLGAFASFSPDALAQTYPTKPIRLVVPNTPGSGPDLIARLIGAGLTKALGQQVYIDNRDGASGRIGMEIAARAPADGYTMVIISGQTTIVEAMYKDLKYNLIRDFAPISLLGTMPSVLVVNPRVPATSVKELVALAKARPGALKYGSSGTGSSSHLAAEIFKFMTGTDILHVPFKSSPPSLTSVLAGELDMTIQSTTGLIPTIESGKLKALGVTSSKPSPLLPKVPSISESVPGYEWVGLYGLLAPAKTPPEILSRLNAEVIKALNTSAVRGQMTTTLGVDALGTSQKEFALFLSNNLKKNTEDIRLCGIRPHN